MRMPIITLYPPWSNWVMLGWKTIETRTHRRFASLAGKRIGIHTAIKWDANALDVARPYLTAAQREQTRDFLQIGGCISGTAFVRKHQLLGEANSVDALIDCGGTERFGLFLSDVRMIECIPAQGRQGIWYHEVSE